MPPIVLKINKRTQSKHANVEALSDPDRFKMFQQQIRVIGQSWIDTSGHSDQFVEHRFTFTSEPRADVPCHLLTPKQGKPPFPIVICLQGHTSGMHLSLGRPKSAADRKGFKNERSYGIQAVGEGYAALVMEQRC